MTKNIFCLIEICAFHSLASRARGFAREFLGLVCSKDPVKVSKDVTSLLICIQKKRLGLEPSFQ